jgi:hypothetical protein
MLHIPAGMNLLGGCKGVQGVGGGVISLNLFFSNWKGNTLSLLTQQCPSLLCVAPNDYGFSPWSYL